MTTYQDRSIETIQKDVKEQFNKIEKKNGA